MSPSRRLLRHRPAADVEKLERGADSRTAGLALESKLTESTPSQAVAARGPRPGDVRFLTYRVP